MSQNTFGLIIIGCVFFGCMGMAAWANWPLIKRWISKHKLLRTH